MSISPWQTAHWSSGQASLVDGRLPFEYPVVTFFGRSPAWMLTPTYRFSRLFIELHADGPKIIRFIGSEFSNLCKITRRRAQHTGRRHEFAGWRAAIASGGAKLACGRRANCGQGL